MLVHNDTVDTDITENPNVHLDNSDIAGGNKSLTVTVSLADVNGGAVTSGDTINYEVSEPNNSLVVTNITPAGTRTSVTLRLDAFKTDSSGEKPLTPGTVNITFTNRTGTVSKLLRCNVYNPATDMLLYWDGSVDPLPLNDFNRENETHVTAVANHTYSLTAGVIPRDSTDRVMWAVSDGSYSGAAGTYITQTDKASITEDGLFSAYSEGEVTIVAKFKATASSPRTSCFGEKELYVNGTSGETETVTVKTVPKYIHVTILKENPVGSIVFTSAPDALEVGETASITAAISAADPSTPVTTDVCTWESSDPSVISVTQDGEITAHARGTATITLYSEKQNVFAEKSIRVIQKADSVLISPSPAATRESVPIELTATMYPEDADDEIVWSVSDESIATVESIADEFTNQQKAVLTGVSRGSVTVTATARHSGVSQTCQVQVDSRIASDELNLTYIYGEVHSPLINGSTINIYTNQEIFINGELLTSDGSAPDDSVAWEITNNGNDYVTVVSNTGGTLDLHGSSEGTVIVKAYSTADPSVSKEFFVQVLKACDNITFYESDGETVYPGTKSVNVGGLTTIKADLIIDGNYPHQHSDRIVSWTSDNTEVAQVDMNGNVRALGNGYANITVRTASGKESSRQIYVFTTSQVIMQNVTPAQDGALPEAHIDIEGGAPTTAFLGVIVKDQYNQAVENVDTVWSSLDESIVTVTNQGVVTSANVGKTTVTVKCGSKQDQCMLTVYANINDAEFENVGPQIYSPIAQVYEPRPTIRYNGVRLIEGADYKLTYENNTGVGSARLTVTGIGYMRLSRSILFDIQSKALTDYDIKAVQPPDVRCTGQEIVVVPEITCAGVLLTPDVDFTYSNINNISPGTAAVIVNGRGNYNGQLIFNYEITCGHEDHTEPQLTREASCTETGIISYHCNICQQDINEELPKLEHDFVERVVAPTANDRGYTLHTCSVCGASYKDNYVDKIEGTSIRDCTAIISGDTFAYTGEPITPTVTLRYDGKTLTQNADYTITYLSNTDIGTGYAIITGIGNYVGTGKIGFTITNGEDSPKTDTNVDIVMTDDDTDTDDGRISITQDDVTVLDPVVYSPKNVPFEPMSNISFGEQALIEDVDYTLAYANNSDVGTATIIMRGIGRFKGVAQFRFDILPKPLSDPEVAVRSVDTQLCTGKAVTPAMIVICDGIILASRRDYKVTYANNVDPGLATATITGIGNYTGTLSVNFEIECAHDYQEQIVAPTHTSRGYTLHTCSICGQSYKDNYTDQLITSDISECNINLEYTTTIYNGKAKTPSVSVRYHGAGLTLGSDYTVTYSNNTEVGLAEVKVRGIGGYTGMQTLTFQIFEGINLGDVNNDGYVSSDDALLTLRYTVNLTDLDDGQKTAADVNSDGLITTEDSLAILRYAVGIGELGPAQSLQ